MRTGFVVGVLGAGAFVVAGCSGGESGDGVATLVDRMGSTVMKASGEASQTSSVVEGKELVLLYNSAAWCPPCRAFTPRLVEFYEDHGGGERFEVVLVSHDRSPAEGMDYMKDYEMPWYMAPLGRTEDLGAYRTGRGIPDLVMLDGSTGEVIATSFEGGEFVGPDSVLSKALARLGG